MAEDKKEKPPEKTQAEKEAEATAHEAQRGYAAGSAPKD